MKKGIFFILFAFGIKNAICQKIDLDHSVTDYIKQSTPQAGKFQQYGNVRGYSNTGAIQISVPLFKIGIKGVDWDISASYSTGGIKVNDVAGCVGLGWHLNAAGMISARIYQRCDVFLENEGSDSANKRYFNLNILNDPTYDNPCSYSNPTDIGFVDNLVEDKSQEDTKYQINYIPDIFYLNAGILNSKFFLKRDTGYCMPSTDLLIVHTPGAYTNNNSYPGSWLVTDENGTKYTFQVKGGSATNRLSWATGESPDGTSSNPIAYSNYNPVFALTQIENVHGEKIYFYYTTECYTQRNNDVDTYRDYTSSSPCTNSGDGFFVPEHAQVISEICEARLDSISTTNGQVVFFNYSSRDDLIGASKLDSTTIYSRTGTATNFVKEYKFNNSYFGTSLNPRELRLRLDSVQERNSSLSVNTQYSFGYCTDSLPSRISFAQDSAGYYNGQYSNTNLVPGYGGSRVSSFVHAQGDILEKIKYPTGGYTLLEYESKQYGGLRVKRIKDSLNTTIVNLRDYTYSYPYLIGYNANHVYSKELNEFQYVCNGPHPMDDIICGYTATYSEPVMTLEDSYYGDQSERYGVVTEYHGASGENGKVEYYYGNPSYRTGMIVQDEYFGGSSNYKKSGGSYVLVKSEGKGYEVLLGDSGGFFDDAANSREVRSWGLDFDVERAAFETSGQDCGGAAGSICYPARYYQRGIRLVSSPLLITGERTCLYVNDTLCTSSAFQYDIEKKLLPARIYSTDSKGNIKVEKIKYPVDFPGITATDTISAGIKNLITKHVINAPIEKSVYLQNSDSSNMRLISSVFTAYRNDIPVPSKLFNVPLNSPITYFTPASVSGGVVTIGSPNEIRVDFTQYDIKGNLLEQQKVDDIKQSYIWDYNYSFPVAIVAKAGQSEIAFTSFEADGKGNWTYSGATTSDNTSPTGGNCYNLSGGNITKSSLTNQTYVVSYWSKSGSAFSINSSSTPTRTGKTINGWTYYEHEVTSTSITISGSNYIDEVRLFPKGTQMTSFTYDPLIGMTSQCDALNRISYYEYDSFGRLRRIKDQDKNIIKVLDYQYNQPQNQ